MRIASLIFGLISLLACRFPLVGRLAAVPAAVGFLFGGIGCVFAPSHCDTKGLAIAGSVLSIMPLAVSTLNVAATDNKLKGPEKSMPAAMGH